MRFCSRGGAGGFAYDELGLDGVSLALRVRILLQMFESLKEGFCQFVAGQAEGGERRMDDVAELDIVEADDGEIRRDGVAEPDGCTHSADGGKVVRCHYSRGAVFEGEEFGHGCNAAGDAKVAGFDELRADDKAGAFHRLLE